MDDFIAELRSGKEWLNDGKCCGQVCSDGVCCAPACVFGEALKYFYKAADMLEARGKRIDEIESTLIDKEVRISELYTALGLLSTLHPDMEVNIDNPVEMADNIVAHVEGRVAAWKGIQEGTANILKEKEVRIAELEQYEKLVQFIANDYHELSHDKAYWQRDDWKKRCKKLIEEDHAQPNN